MCQSCAMDAGKDVSLSNCPELLYERQRREVDKIDLDTGVGKFQIVDVGFPVNQGTFLCAIDASENERPVGWSGLIVHIMEV